MSDSDLSIYPILVEEVDTPLGGIAPGGGPATGAPFTTTVEQAIRTALAWRPRDDDPKAFLAALNTSFTVEAFEGRTNVRWTPRTYASTIGAGLGAVTGAQASLLSRARVEIDAAL